ncbi:MAG TPA: hypothetical protein VH351_16555 [Bryobacteraceae bacterium]|nr:hypothetical protein [Bryobacteraceae bacterium]
MNLRLRADDRVLLLAIPEPAVLAAMARILVRGVIVAMGAPERVDQARQAFAEFDNVMLLDAGPAGIPWRDGYFSKIVVPADAEASSEWTRVLAPEGEILREDVAS